MTEIKKDDILTLEITEISNLGCGVAKTDNGMVVFVNGAVTGDIVKAKIIKTNKSFCVGKLESIIKDSPYREQGFCDAPLSCGGCIYRHVTYSHELELKQNYVKHCFIKAGLPDVKVGNVLTTGETNGYRNKAQYPLLMGKNGVQAGFYASRTHRIVPCDYCSLGPSIFADIVKAFCGFATKNNISVYDEESGRGLLRHLYLRMGKGSGEIMVCIVTNGKSIPCTDELCKILTSEFPSIKSIMLNINEKQTNVILGDKYVSLFGLPYITDILCGKCFHISAGSFYQVNHDGAELLYGKAAELADFKGDETLLDLYCGIGTIGLSMSDHVKKLIGIEIVPEAVMCAKENALLNSVPNADFFCGDASSAKAMLASAFSEGTRPDIVIIDPPRKGSTPELITYIAELEIPKVVYISCDPDTLARDCVLFRSLGYEIGEVTPVDLFSRTGHVETVVLLSRKSSERIHFELKIEDIHKRVSKTATYSEIKAYVKEKYGLTVSSLYIAQIKEKLGIKDRENYFKGKDGHRVPLCPPEKEQAITDAFKHFGMV